MRAMVSTLGPPFPPGSRRPRISKPFSRSESTPLGCSKHQGPGAQGLYLETFQLFCKDQFHTCPTARAL